MPADFPVVFALYPDVTQLDFTGPLEVLARLPQARIVLAAARGGTLAAGGVTFADVVPLAQVEDCALLCVPGGFGCSAAMADGEYLGALRRLASHARYVTSVCTGSLLLGAAGLLEGIDMALALSAEIAGEDHAQAVQLAMEYAPEPPFAAGRPENARPEILALVRARFERVWPDRLAAAERAAQALARDFAHVGGSDTLSGP